MREYLTEHDTLAIDAPGRGLRQEIVRVAAGAPSERGPGDHEELLFVVAGTGRLTVDGTTHPLEPETAVRIAPGERYAVAADGDEELRLVSTLVLDPPTTGGSAAPRVLALAARRSDSATADRAFRILFDPEAGCGGATQFVGFIPPGRAPDHFHRYDELICVLEGAGTLHVGGASAPLRAGSCVRLPAGTVHCVENAGPAPMRVLGVFRPAGSPAAAFYPDRSAAPAPA